MKKSSLFRVLTIIMCLVVTISMCAVVVTASGETMDADFDDYTTTTTIVVPDYATQLEYDNSPMAVGETRAIRFYHPKTNTAKGGSIYEVSENLSISYEEGSDTVYVTALSEGSAKLYIRESDCAFGAYAYLTVENEEPVLCFPQGDVNQDGKLTTGDARMVLQYCLTDVAFLQNDVNALADYNGNGKIETSDAREILIATLVA